MIHVAHVIDALHPGGAERMLVEIANATPKDDYRVSVIPTRSEGLLARSLHSDVRLFPLHRRGRFDISGLRRFWKFCREEQVDVLHVHGRSSYMLVAFSRILRRLPRRCSIVMHDHFGDVEIRPALPLLLRSMLFVLQPLYVGVHPKLVEVAGSGRFRCRQTVLVNNALSFNRYESQGAPPPGIPARGATTLGVMVANVRPTKDVLLLLRSLVRIRDLEWEMLLVGATDGEYADRCLAETKRLNLHDRVHFLGVREDIPAVLQVSDFAVLSSRSEAGPLALIEYVAAGLPFVSTSVGSIARQLMSLGTGRFVAAGDEEGLSTALRELMQDTGSRDEAKRARDRARPLFDIDATIPKWEALYRRTQGDMTSVS